MNLQPVQFSLRSAFILILLCLVPALAYTVHNGEHFDSQEALIAYILKNPNLSELHISGSPRITSLPALPRSLSQLWLLATAPVSSASHNYQAH